MMIMITRDVIGVSYLQSGRQDELPSLLFKSLLNSGGLWFLVRFGGECDSYIRTLGCFRLHNFLWVRLRILVKWTRWALRFETVRELVVCKYNGIFLFLVTKVTWSFCFSQGVNSIRGHESSLLVLRKCFRGDETLDLKQF